MDETQSGVSHVFLSASVPDPSGDQRYYATASLLNIRDAVCSLTELVVHTAELVFGGHPAISPMTSTIATQLGRPDAISIYQSEFFRSSIPPSTLAFSKRIIWTPEVPGDRQGSLDVMRTTMVGRSSRPPFGVGFFIGGMEGVEREFELFRRLQPNAAFWPIASTGGAARLLFDRARTEVLSQPAAGKLGAALEPLLEQELNYRKVVRTLLALS
jgi:SLOG-like protein